MEWYIYLLRAVIVCIAVGGLAAVLKLITRILLRQETAKLLHGDRRKRNLAYRVIRISCPDTVLLRNIAFPKDPNGDMRETVVIPLIAVNRGGVILITTRLEGGRIDNPYRGDWVSFADDGSGAPFANPFEANETYRQTLSLLFEKEQTESVSFQSVAVFTAKGVKFHHRTEMLVTPEKLGDLINDIGKNRFLSRREIRKVVAILKKYGTPFRSEKRQLQKNL